MTAALRLLVVDDHPLYCAGVQAALGRAMPDLEVLVAESAEAAAALLRRVGDLDLCLSDLRLPGADGFALLQQVARDFPSVGRGLLCAEPTAQIARRARAEGCVACLSKARDMHGLAEAIGSLFAGASVFDGESGAQGLLSQRRRDVLELAARGMSNKAIARELGIGERTVKDHWSEIFSQLEVANRAEAVSRAHRLRLID